jgi:uncharacterized protein (DUF1499 family)
MIEQIHYGDNGEQRFLQKNPLSICPDSPNCIRLSIYIPKNPEKLLTDVEIIIDLMGGKQVMIVHDKFVLTSVFNVFIFRDDFIIQLMSFEDGSILHLKSSSRIGYGDLGVNKRRVKDFLKKLHALLNEEKNISE